MSRILIWMSPEAGHVLPSIKVCRDLVGRGHRVVYLTCGRICGELEGLGFETTPWFPEHEDIVAARSVLHSCAPARSMYQGLRESYDTPESYVIAFREQLAHAARNWHADLFLVDGIFDGLLALGTAGLLRGLCPVGRLYIHLPYREPADDADDRHGPAIYLSPRCFEIPQYFRAGAIYTEASLFHDLRPADFWAGTEPSAEVVYCSLGTQAELYERTPDIFEQLFQVAAQLPRFEFVLSCGSSYRPEFNDRLPNLQCAPYVPLARVLRRTRVAISHGGFGIVKACIASKVPMLLIPQHWDQPANGIRVRHHGLGVSMPSEDATVSRLCHTIEFLATDTGVASRLLAMEGAFRRAEVEEPAANACEAILAGAGCGTNVGSVQTPRSWGAAAAAAPPMQEA